MTDFDSATPFIILLNSSSSRRPVQRRVQSPKSKYSYKLCHRQSWYKASSEFLSHRRCATVWLQYFPSPCFILQLREQVFDHHTNHTTPLKSIDEICNEHHRPACVYNYIGQTSCFFLLMHEVIKQITEMRKKRRSLSYLQNIASYWRRHIHRT